MAFFGKETGNVFTCTTSSIIQSGLDEKLRADSVECDAVRDVPDLLTDGKTQETQLKAR